MKDQYVLKICIIGSNYDLTKRTIALVAEQALFTDYSPTIGFHSASHVITFQGQEIKLILEIIRGEEHFGKLRRLYYEGSVGCIIIFDKGDRPSFNAASYWGHEYREVRGPDKPIVIYGVKIDAEEITTEEGNRVATALNCLYFESISSDRKTVNDIFIRLVEANMKDHLP